MAPPRTPSKELTALPRPTTGARRLTAQRAPFPKNPITSLGSSCLVALVTDCLPKSVYQNMPLNTSGQTPINSASERQLSLVVKVYRVKISHRFGFTDKLWCQGGRTETPKPSIGWRMYRGVPPERAEKLLLKIEGARAPVLHIWRRHCLAYSLSNFRLRPTYQILLLVDI